MNGEPTTLQDFSVIVSPETERGTRTVTVRQGRQTDAEGPMVLDRDQRATASVTVQAEERSDGASVTVDTDLFVEAVGDSDSPSSEELADALFETLAALADLQERLTGGAQLSGVPAEEVVRQVWSAYDLEDADRVFERSGHERADAATPEEFAIEELVPREDVDAVGGGEVRD